MHLKILGNEVLKFKPKQKLSKGYVKVQILTKINIIRDYLSDSAFA